MDRRFIILIAFTIISGLSCSTLLNNANKTVSVYKLPFNNSNYIISYYMAVTIKNFKQHSNIKVYMLNNRKFYTSLNDYVSNLDTLSPSDKLNSLDLRVLIEYKNRKDTLIQIGLDQAGRSIINGHVYDPNDHLLRIIEKYTNIKWQCGWINSE